jgi:hypothetical protein
MSFKQTKLTNNFQTIIDRATPAAKQIAGQTATVALEYAQEIVPSQTGELRDSGEIREGENGRYDVVFMAPHARPLNNGTRHTAPRYFLEEALVFGWQALKEKRQAFLKIIRG